MNETTIEELYNLVKAIDEGNAYNEIIIDREIADNAKLALDRMIEIK